MDVLLEEQEKAMLLQEQQERELRRPMGVARRGMYESPCLCLAKSPPPGYPYVADSRLVPNSPLQYHTPVPSRGADRPHNQAGNAQNNGHLRWVKSWSEAQSTDTETRRVIKDEVNQEDIKKETKDEIKHEIKNKIKDEIKDEVKDEVKDKVKQEDIKKDPASDSEERMRGEVGWSFL
ncbi:hypothetical protein CLAFUW4_00311 [Fulvia fulva]|uniref:uncharacterized protein n=1 Tax=Passalora fulva TaxID=5499 RepID=UPI0028529BC9|nr:uncharacterized protein CLAFUR5_20121 [Fulvia fulva]KAK4636022.1 hypothetical protein CLAFUR4_00311 [Fulvia fulva]KAK4638611.1 hypothetical protein CLAFUR0_00312 [Fulvia fulva]WMI38747.1 hypothetical protein CLAFUR5_20121 [Fulvia fulva]WPV09035.1 hypothetical protein CLAFUW4_00311 [Fulvia fulva]WPV24149.1 hypothetical protein CLAFUW7_00315 [Fulvia fulva]